MDNIIPHSFQVTKKDRNKKKNHRSLVIWFTGLSGSGKSTVANALEQKLFSEGYHTYILDGDNVRKGLNKNLSFSPEDRKENIRRIAEVAHLMTDAGLVVLSAFVSPYREDREQIKAIVGENQFIEIYVNTPIEVCEQRDVKGLYAKARAGEIKDFTGVNAPYEAPENAFIEVDTSQEELTTSVMRIFKKIVHKLTLNNG